MIINDNLMSLFAAQNLQNTQNDLQKVLQQLSSGLRINSAADDAAGLAIAQKMEAQINGLNQAKRNAQDAISLVQTAGGALTEIQSMLQRMRELAVQAASDSETPTDRAQIQKEVDQLAAEIHQIATTAQFNTQKLLDGSFQNRVFQVGANQGESLQVSIANVDSLALGVEGTVYNWSAVTNPLTFTAGATDPKVASVTANTGYVGRIGNGTYTLNFTVDSSGNVAVTMVDSNGQWVASGTGKIVSGQNTSIDIKDGFGNTVLTVTDNNSAATPAPFQTGTGTVTISGTTTTTSVQYGVDVSTAMAASNALNTLDQAINVVNSQQALLGAYQNRLQHVTNVNAIAYENLTSAKAQIMDVDMASAMAQFTRDQILQQAGVAALAQANQVPAAVLKLLG
ncbi:MAG: flagellin [Firmicutes bacterium]|nr:flagellin [Bacillota bacterium]